MAVSKDIVWVGGTISCPKILFPGATVHNLADSMEQARLLQRARINSSFTKVTVADGLRVTSGECVVMGIVGSKVLQRHVQQAMSIQSCKGMGFLVGDVPKTDFLQEIPGWTYALRELHYSQFGEGHSHEGCAVLLVLVKGNVEGLATRLASLCGEGMSQRTCPCSACPDPDGPRSTMSLVSTPSDEKMKDAVDLLRQGAPEGPHYIDSSRKRRKISTTPLMTTRSSRNLVLLNGDVYVLGVNEALMSLGWCDDVNLHLLGSLATQQSVISGLLPKALVRAACEATLKVTHSM
ncbi:unnamed protein product [Symbiodinium natans]|uniref:Uncharacterized protein n=3 Tax=Symbiodinium natans TaxID=878477 RepID=A0A812V7S2_9DINO|nr:unnamed protein product [Symbiodinium natans]